MNELSLFTGAGGGILGTHLLGWTPIGYVEWDDYCQRVLAARIADGLIARAPIFGDVRQFVESGAAREYRGFADVVSAGFPCQPFAISGRQLGADDERNMWPATADVIRMVRPDHIKLENVPGLLTSGYFGTVLADLAAMGYVGRWGCISAAHVGAPHLRQRLWIVAHANGIVGESRPRHFKQSGQSEAKRRNYRSDTFHRGCGWVEMASEFRRMDDGVADPVDRTKALGNGQVPRVVAAAWRLLA